MRVTFGTATALLAAAFGLGLATTATAQEFTMKLAHHYPDVHIQAAGIRTFVSEIEKNSNGRIKVTVYPAETLVTGREALEAVEGRVVDAAPMPTNYQTGNIPELEYFTYPFMFDSAQHFRRAVDGGIREKLAGEYAKYNVQLVNFYHKGALHLMHKTGFLETPDKFAGQRLRSLGGTISQLLSSMGANPLSVALGEVDAAIERNVIDGITTNCAAHLSRGWYEGLRFVTFADMSQGGEGMGVNADFLASLPADLQKVVLDAAKTMEDQEWSDMINDDEVACMDKWKAAGVEVRILTAEERAAFQERMTPILAEAVKARPGLQSYLDIAAATR